MKQPTPLQHLLTREVSRREFLTTVGYGMVAMVGLSSIIKFLTGRGHSTHGQASSGYGNSVYGK